MVPVELPSAVEETVRAVFGAAGARWIVELPGVVAELAARWGLSEFTAPFGGGTHAYVAGVSRGGRPAVLKVPMVDEENVAEATALYAYDGDGAVRLLDFDVDSGAMLLEWARPGTELLNQPGFPSLEGHPENAAKVRSACQLYRRLRRPAPAVLDGFPAFPLATDLVAGLRERLATPNPALAQHVSAQLREMVRQWCDTLGESGEPVLIVNRDTHLGNIVAAEREPWLLIDPKPCLGEAAFDAGFLLMIQVQSDPTPEHAATVIAATAAALDVDPERACGWALIRTVEELTWAVEDNDREMRDLHAAVANALARPPLERPAE
ncbi:aminoglycoside phosphotransferase family protein [Nocardia caishijiensis]|uniref:Streptomycin 6-kinase n=1 Tax=Nocardia caishijiensis TaxID=184756 RepID=A0ABQ6YFR9_9NOCA|nr:aminoglycoside phosphotransferase family protein [Nocardia caishijiensis]KAF0836606.1 streptomycin 6-kinase [Nocardia caishijiensis]